MFGQIKCKVSEKKEMKREKMSCSLWKKLPKNIIDLIYSFDSSYHEYFRKFILRDTQPLFYQTVMNARYLPHKADLLQILNECSHKKKKYPLWSDLQIICNYTMSTPAQFCSCNRIIRKQIFRYRKKIHWYICVETEISLSLFISKLMLTMAHIDFLGFSDICLFNDLSETHENIVADTTGKALRKNLKWFDDKEFCHAVFTDFDIIVKNHLLEMDILKIFTFHDKIYMSIEFDHNRSSHYHYNKSVYDMFIYYINMRLKPNF